MSLGILAPIAGISIILFAGFLTWKYALRRTSSEQHQVLHQAATPATPQPAAQQLPPQATGTGYYVLSVLGSYLWQFVTWLYHKSLVRFVVFVFCVWFAWPRWIGPPLSQYWQKWKEQFMSSLSLSPPSSPSAFPSQPAIDLTMVQRAILGQHNAHAGWTLLPASMDKPITIGIKGVSLLPISGLGALPNAGVELEAFSDARQGLFHKPLIFYLGPDDRQHLVLVGYSWSGSHVGMLRHDGAVFVRSRAANDDIMPHIPVSPAQVRATILGERERITSRRLVWERIIVPKADEYTTVRFGAIPLANFKAPLNLMVAVLPACDRTTRRVEHTEISPVLFQEALRHGKPVRITVRGFDGAGRALRGLKRGEEVESFEDILDGVAEVSSETIIAKLKDACGTAPEYGEVSFLLPFPATCHVAMFFGKEEKK